MSSCTEVGKSHTTSSRGVPAADDVHSAAPRPEVTQILDEWRAGDAEALDRVIPLLYAELRSIAEAHLRSERHYHTLQPTALLHEAYLRLADHDRMRWQNRTHFLAVSANIMRRLLVDYARARNAQKRGGGQENVSMGDVEHAVFVQPNLDLLDLDHALERLEELDEQQARTVELRYFSGLSIRETAEVLGISVATVKRDWQTAKAWLWRELSTSRRSQEDLGPGTADSE